MIEIDVCDTCATDPLVTLAADPNNGHPGGYGSVDPCDRCGDGGAGHRYRAILSATEPLLRLPLAGGDTPCPTCRNNIAAVDIDARGATAFCRFCRRVYPCFHDELHRTDLGGGHEISPVRVAVVGESLIYSANCLCQNLISSMTAAGASEWIAEHTAEVVAEHATA